MKYVFVGLIVIISLIVFTVSNTYLRGYLDTPGSLAVEIQSPADSLYNYTISTKAPFKFRILFPLLVTASYQSITNSSNADLFFTIYKFWSAVFYVLAALLFYYLLRLNYNRTWSFTGVLLYLFTPAILLAYTVPVHTREDTLGYAIFFAGLILIQKQHYWGLLSLSILGAFCRETLLLLPLLYFLFTSAKPLYKGVILFIPIALWLLYRLLHREHYDYLEGFRWNVSNVEQVVGFLFIVFNLLWLSALGGLLKWRSLHSTSFVSFFFKSFFVALPLVLLSTFFGGIFNEIRLLHLLCPWIIIFSLEYMKNNYVALIKFFSLRSFQFYIVVIFLMVIFLGYVIPPKLNEFVSPGKFDVPYVLWLSVSLVYVGLFLIAVPVFISISLRKNTDEV